MSVKNKKTINRIEDKHINDIISRGSPVQQDSRIIKKRPKKLISLLIDHVLLENLDAYKKKRIGISRNGIIEEAIHEKLTNTDS